MKKKSKPRDLWIFQSWHYRGAGYFKNKKKQLPRKLKHKGPEKDLFNCKISLLISTNIV